MHLENVHPATRWATLGDVGRPRIRPPGETIALGFKAEPELIEALDAEAARLSAERPPGSARISRAELIKIILHDWLEKRSPARH